MSMCWEMTRVLRLPTLGLCELNKSRIHYFTLLISKKDKGFLAGQSVADIQGLDSVG
jgi:hypothetical protein